ncbi:hypothetical protein GCM10008922_00630 [Faecalicatena contorta]|uniref:hypothetical protein n=1 Tax=Faecalicatena contorta TaxID=39482 RepID=UPI0031CEBD09
MNKIFTDIKIAATLFADVRKARKTGGKIEIKRYTTKPVLGDIVGFYNTVEGCVLSHCAHEIVEAARDAFYQLPHEEQYRFRFAPETGEFIERAQYWKALLQPVLTPKQCTAAMMIIIRWYIHIKRTRQGEV